MIFASCWFFKISVGERRGLNFNEKICELLIKFFEKSESIKYVGFDKN